MTTKTITTKNLYEKHENPIGELVQEACKYRSELRLNVGTKKINPKSMMFVLYLPLGGGDEIEIEANGGDEAEAVAALENFLTCR